MLFIGLIVAAIVGVIAIGAFLLMVFWPWKGKMERLEFWEAFRYVSIGLALLLFLILAVACVGSSVLYPPG